MKSLWFCLPGSSDEWLCRRFSFEPGEVWKTTLAQICVCVCVWMELRITRQIFAVFTSRCCKRQKKNRWECRNIMKVAHRGLSWGEWINGSFSCKTTIKNTCRCARCENNWCSDQKWKSVSEHCKNNWTEPGVGAWWPPNHFHRIWRVQQRQQCEKPWKQDMFAI